MHTSILLIAFLGPTKADYICCICEFAKWLNFFATLSSVVDWFALNTATPPASLTSCTSPHNTIDQHVFFLQASCFISFYAEEQFHTHPRNARAARVDREAYALAGGSFISTCGIASSLLLQVIGDFIVFFVIVFLLSDAARACFRLTQGFHCSDLLLGNRRRSSQFSGRLDWFEKLSRQHQQHQHTQQRVCIDSLVQRLKSIRTSWI